MRERRPTVVDDTESRFLTAANFSFEEFTSLKGRKNARASDGGNRGGREVERTSPLPPLFLSLEAVASR